MIFQATPNPFATPTPIATYAATSERSVIVQGLDAANARAQAIGGTLGAVIIDLESGVILDRNGDVSFPMASVQKLMIAIVTYGAIDDGKLEADTAVQVVPEDVVPSVSPIADAFATRQVYTIQELLSAMLRESDNTAAKALMRKLGGIDALNGAIRDLGYSTIVVGANDDGVATPSALGRVLSDLAGGQLLRPLSRKALMDTLATVQTFPGRLRAGLPPGARLLHKTGTEVTDGVATQTNDVGIVYIAKRPMIVVAMLKTSNGTETQHDEVLAAVARAAATAATTLNP